MKRTTTRILSVALSATLACSLFGAPALADTNDASSDVQDESIASVESSSEDTASTVESTNSEEDTSSSLSDSSSASSDAVEYADSTPVVDEITFEAESPEGTAMADLSTSKLEVEVIDARPYVKRAGETEGAKEVAFSFAIDDQPTETKTVSKGTDATYSAKFISQDLQNGSHTLRVSGDKFIQYEQTDIELNGGLYKMKLYAGEAPVGDNNAGIIRYGSLKGADSIGDADIDALISGIENKTEENADLNMDGKVNLVDLQVMSKVLNQQSAIAKVHPTVVAGGDADNPTGDMTGDESTEIKAEADGIVQSSQGGAVTEEQLLASLVDNFKQDSSGEDAKVGVATKNGEPISESNSVGITLSNLQNALSSSNITSADQDAVIEVDPDGKVRVEGVSIKTPIVDDAGTGSIIEGMVAAYYEDENGNEQAIEVAFRPDGGAYVSSVANVSDLGKTAAAVMQQTASIPRALTPAGAMAKASGANTIPAARNTEALVQASPVKAAGRVLGDTVGQTSSSVSNGVITINFGKRIAIKRITITITKAQATNGDTSLAEITSVQFLNNMEEAVKPPEMSIPANVKTVAGSRQFTVSWDAQSDVTGYEICVEDKAKGKQQIYFVDGASTTSYTVQRFSAGYKGNIENGVEYTVKVQSVNGNWRSGWSAETKAKPMATSAPLKPTNLKTVGGYRYITVSWPAVEDADTYTLFYRVKGSGAAWTQVSNITNLNYTLQNLPDYTTYEVYLTASNNAGTSPASNTFEATTTSVTAAKLPNYMLVNTQDGNGSYFTHITSATIAATNYTVNDSEVDSASNGAMCLFDGKFESNIQVNDWDLGTSYNQYTHGVKVDFDSAQEIGMISFAAAVDNVGYSNAKVRAFMADGSVENVQGTVVSQRDGGNGRRYTLIKLPKPVNVTSIMVGVNRLDGGRGINIAEMRFHGYNTIEDEIDALYDNSTPETANMHIKLLDSLHEASSDGRLVGDVEMDRLQAKLNEQDHGEDYPYKTIAKAELDYARQLLKDEQNGLKKEDVQAIHTDLADAYDANKNLGISGLNAWQPLGRVAHENQEIVVYVNAPNTKDTRSKIDLYIGQKYGTASYAPKRVGTFPVGRTVFTIPSSVFSNEAGSSERGGSLYVQYTGNDANEKWSVRVLGAQKIPTLDLYKVEGADRAVAVETYVNELNEYVQTIESTHNESHGDIAYSDPYCVSNSTEIMLDKIMFSVPAKKVQTACGGNADNLLAAADGADQLMQLFYQHKGLMETSDGATGKNVSPARHLNIRCMQMTGNAFMYAAGNHIGVGYDQSANFCMLREITNNEPGQTKASGEGKYFGWGTAHEIGHNINDSRYVYAEVTNNYFAQICATINGVPVRWGSDYKQVYDRVTSGAKGRVGGVGTQLAMYWQLMLAYDSNQVYTMYGTQSELLKNRFFARVDSYARDNSLFTGSVPLSTANIDEQQSIMRLASAAANKNLTEFFTSWGFTPSSETARFMEQFDKEERAIQYVCEETAFNIDSALGASLKGATDVMEDITVSSTSEKVAFEIVPTEKAKGNIHGFEVSRITYEKGKKQEPQVIAFVQEENGKYVFTDSASGLGNRMVQYEVTAIDRHLNRSAVKTTAEVKLKGAGAYNTSGWEVETNMVQLSPANSAPDDADSTDAENASSCDGEKSADNSALKAVLVDAGDTPYVGKTERDGSAAEDPYVVINMGKVQTVEHLEYTLADAGKRIGAYEVYLSADGKDWGNPVITGNNLEYDAQGSGKLYMEVSDDAAAAEGAENGYIGTASAQYVKIVAKGQAERELSINRLTVYGPSGSDVEFTTIQQDGNTVPAIGILENDFVLDAEKNEYIPKGSIIFTGSFVGNPAYANILLFDEQGNVVGGVDEEGTLHANEVILAPKPSDAGITDTWDGRWIYWIAPQDIPDNMKVRAELYRVDNAFTNEGERIVSDCGYVHVAKNLPTIQLTDDGVNAVQNQTENTENEAE